MKVELQIGDTIAIPEGCKAIVKDGSVVFEREKEDKEFKDGDILIDDRKLSEFPCKIIMIYKGTKSKEGCYECYIFRNLMGSLVISKGCCSSEFVKIRHATEEEKQILFDKMKEQGLRWNADKKCIEQFRWRAKLRERYYFFDEFLNVKFDRDENFEIDELRWSIGNYFKTRKDAEAALLMVKELLKNKKLQNG